MKQLFTPRTWLLVLTIFLASAIVVCYIWPDITVTVVAVVISLLAVTFGEFVIWFYNSEIGKIKDLKLLTQGQSNELYSYRQSNKYLRNHCKELKDRIKSLHSQIRARNHHISQLQRNEVALKENEYNSERRDEHREAQEDIRILRQENKAYVLEIEGLKEELTEQKEENASMRLELQDVKSDLKLQREQSERDRVTIEEITKQKEELEQELQDVKSDLKLQREQFERDRVMFDEVLLEQWNDSMLLQDELSTIMSTQGGELAVLESDREIFIDQMNSDLMILHKQLEKVMLVLDTISTEPNLHHMYMYFRDVCDLSQLYEFGLVPSDLYRWQASISVVPGIIEYSLNRDIVVGNERP